MTETTSPDLKKELHLSHFTMENLHEAVFWIDENQCIFQVNALASSMSGYSKEELVQLRVKDLNPSFDLIDWITFWKRLKNEKRIVFEAQHRHKDGHLYDIEITGNFIELDGKEFSCSIVRDIRDKKAQEKLLRDRLSEIELYNSTVKAIRDQIFWIDKSGKFIRVNDAVSKESGFSPAELEQMTVFNLNPSLTKAEWDKSWSETKKTGRQVFETSHRDKKGNIYPVEVTNNFIEHNGNEYFCSSVRDIQRKKREEGILRSISESTSPLTGADYFRELTKFITSTLNVRYSMVVSCSETNITSLRMLSYVDRQEIKENFEYSTKGTPCEIVMQGKEFFCPDKLDEQFPREKGLKSWVAVPIYSPASGTVIGNIAAFDNVSMENEESNLAILRIFAARAGAEIDRLKAEEKLKIANADLKVLLQESEERFRDLFEEAPIAYVHEGLDSKFIKANKAALRILGVKPEDVPYTYGKTMAPDTPDAQRRMREAFESIGRGTDTSGVVLEMRRQDNGEPLWIQWWSNPDPSGTFTRTMFLDITEQVLMEQEQARLQAQNKYLQEEIKLNNNFEEIISKSKNFQKVLQQLEKVASTDSTVLILGESGTDKELLARAVHNISNRSKRPLVKVNCATLPANLIESELFGHEKGAFTGAMEKKIGRFELADGGTIFLDEIAELPFELQAKLLRVLQEGEFERLGNPRTMKVNVRVIAATNRNLEQAIEKKEFREDLFYRLNVFPIISPPLRDRKEDIPLLVKHFCQKHEAKIGKKIIHIEPEVIDALMEYNWPGNIREVENLIERAMIISAGNILEYGDWLPSAKHTGTSSKSSLIKMDDVEKQHITDVLKKAGWKVSGEGGAAKLLGLNPTTLEARMKKLGIKREDKK